MLHYRSCMVWCRWTRRPPRLRRLIKRPSGRLLPPTHHSLGSLFLLQAWWNVLFISVYLAIYLSAYKFVYVIIAVPPRRTPVTAKPRCSVTATLCHGGLRRPFLRVFLPASASGNGLYPCTRPMVPIPQVPAFCLLNCRSTWSSCSRPLDTHF